MIESYKPLTENQKELINQWIGTDARLIAKGDILVFKDTDKWEMSLDEMNEMQLALSKVFPNQTVVILPMNMEIEIFKEV
jgi:hypothetical protein